MSENCNEGGFSKGLIFGLLFGATAGAITALLLAPKSGKELRRDLADRSGEIYGNVETAVSSAVNVGKAKAQEIITSAKKQADVLIKNAEKMVTEARSKATDAKGSVQSTFETLKDATKAGVDAFKDELKTSEG
jgi:gas vesicle protein